MSNSASVWVPILVAIVTGLVTVITIFLTGRANSKLEREKFVTNSQLEQQKFDASSKLERQKFESSLILQIIATGEQETALKNLEFLVSAGFLPDPEGKIKELAQRPSDTPVLPARRGATTKAPLFRWGVRTGSDRDAQLVEETPVQTTVEELAEKSRPRGMKNPTRAYAAYQDGRSKGVERTIYEVTAEIVAYKLQQSGNYHLDLKGDTGRTMIANCVDPQRANAGSRWEKQIVAVRKKVEEKLKPTNVYTLGSWPVRIAGIGFFNQLHGQHGAAPNGIELSPVLTIDWLS